MTKRAHLIGICGAGMSAVARLLQQTGYEVTGSDSGIYPPVSTYLTQLGLHPIEGHRADNLPSDPDLIVIGKHATLVPETNEEVRAAFSYYADRVRSFPQVLAQLTEDRRRTVVAGSYGKSSLSTLITHALLFAERDPGWFIGAIPRGLSHSSHIGGTGPFIFEGDEYPSANFDDRSKFLHYQPHTVVLTSATHDHVNVFPTLADYHRPFGALLQDLATREGCFVACTDERHAARFFDDYDGTKVSYGLVEGADFTARAIKPGDPLEGTPTRFDLLARGELIAGMQTLELGRHAVQNICGAAAYLLGEKQMSPALFREAVGAFQGLTRRLDRKAENGPYLIYEGFGSSLEKARSAIEAARLHFPDRRLVVLFEPHTFTWRNKKALDQYDRAFDGVDQVYVAAPPETAAGSHDQASLDEIVERIRANNETVTPLPDPAAIVDILPTLSPSKDFLLILSSGSFGGHLPPLLDRAEAAGTAASS
ncbi:putative UDP-N-acetylmuramate:L-alanyl-gamma-D-glutamyl-meso-diamino pimelate ligase [Parvularcula bermudensis HTCC2503]|uniref:Putative UDP-N-acetylmuramate:L-alanyl-gamma-D-glutamyl-meso-diamino pimelate ligase n=1 Tax=Parvularcula bermudensis (strain ATCC BAA-594 / HTCC2503 / KCTC 12087) TaxID=314260 RepID=E0TDS1_PARBH|nr:Mur ligase domain-containing protein [Parvularcula bermudensis]ADM09987.1 putative UDP-N-acetylmuramate:L-alanyl-gamma-D-glutamyl-meso-diamino pimelate ligase [Parvularcula bermudensis HTCC2503]